MILNPSGPLLPRSSRGRRAGDEGAAPSKTRSRPRTVSLCARSEAVGTEQTLPRAGEISLGLLRARCTPVRLVVVGSPADLLADRIPGVPPRSAAHPWLCTDGLPGRIPAHLLPFSSLTHPMPRVQTCILLDFCATVIAPQKRSRRTATRPGLRPLARSISADTSC